MIAFVTSLRHPSNADDYAFTESLLFETLRSIEAQTSTEYRVFIVGNRRPLFDLPARAEFVEVDFAPPVRTNGPHADRSGFVRDKGTKIGVGLIAARKYEPDWVMIFDADDFVHRELTRFVHEHPLSPGWVIREGWIYSRQRNGYRSQKEFNRTCGTCFVLPFEAYSVPEHLDVDADQEELIRAYGETLPSIMGAHRNAVEWHRERGRDLQALPFRGAVYHVDTGENHSGKALQGIIRPWNTRLEDDFSIRSRMPCARTLWASAGPKALTQSVFAFVLRAGKAVRRRVARLTARGASR